jgi:DNA-binding transcriptional ArsR family regulator
VVEVPGLGAIVEQIKARIGQIEEQLRQHRDLSDELERLRDALSRLEGGVAARVRGRRASAKASSPGTTAAAERSRAAKKSPPAKRSAAASGPGRAAASAPRGQTRAKILDALKDGPKTAGEIAAATGIGRGTASTTLTKLAKSGDVVKAERGYRLPD